MSKFRVRYSLRARHEEIEVLDYIVKKFGVLKAKEVFDKIEDLLDHIKEMPEMFPASKKYKNLRKCVVSKQTSLYYAVNDDYIEVVSLRINRKDPKGFKI